MHTRTHARTHARTRSDNGQQVIHHPKTTRILCLFVRHINNQTAPTNQVTANEQNSAYFSCRSVASRSCFSLATKSGVTRISPDAMFSASTKECAADYRSFISCVYSPIHPPTHRSIVPTIIQASIMKTTNAGIDHSLTHSLTHSLIATDSCGHTAARLLVV